MRRREEWPYSPPVSEPPLDISRIFELEPHGPDTFVGESPPYSWGRIYGGLVIAQALWAATQTVPREHGVHSLQAYFILGGELDEPVRYEVDRVRNGRSFTTRRVLARQSGGAILTLECSFQRAEAGADTQTAVFPSGVPSPEDLESELDAGIERCNVKTEEGPPRSLIWARYPLPLPDDPRIHACAMAYLSDENAMDAVWNSHPDDPHSADVETMGASLDHAVWFLRPIQADDWNLIDMTAHGMVGTRGLATGHVFGRDGSHVVTIAQEGVLRVRAKP